MRRWKDWYVWYQSSRHYGEGPVAAERFCAELRFDPRHSRPDPEGRGRWWSIGPFGHAGAGRPKGVLERRRRRRKEGGK